MLEEENNKRMKIKEIKTYRYTGGVACLLLWLLFMGSLMGSLLLLRPNTQAPASKCLF